MLAKIYSGATQGMASELVEVEIDVAGRGLPSVTMVGLASKAVDESKERVRSALKNSDADFPGTKVTINLAPADIPKEGPAYDLPLALGLLVASGQIEADLSDALIFGELSLDGTVRHTKGALPLTLLAKERGFKRVFLPQANAAEVSVVKDVAIYPVTHLRQLVAHLLGMDVLMAQPSCDFLQLATRTQPAEFDFADIKGQELAKRALEIAAAGGHNVFLFGTPGAGKTMMARAFAGILPSLTEKEAIEVTKIYSITGNIPAGHTVVSTRPFRHPHHTTSKIGLIGGGSRPMPGEISLAHRGVLFLDEFPEFPSSVLESLRQPLEDGIVQISRAAGTMQFPARFMLISAANPCPCGYYGSKLRPCQCLASNIHRYQKKISGPILDRIDLHVQVHEVPIETLAQLKQGESSNVIRARVETARTIQNQRYKGISVTCNAELSSKQVKEYCQLDTGSQKLLIQAANKLNLSARSFNKMYKIARTIADIAQSQEISLAHVTEALHFRPKLE